MSQETLPRITPELRAAFDEVVRQAINVGGTQVYADINRHRESWLRFDEQALKRAKEAFWKALKEEG